MDRNALTAPPCGLNLLRESPPGHGAILTQPEPPRLWRTSRAGMYRSARHGDFGANHLNNALLRQIKKFT